MFETQYEVYNDYVDLKHYEIDYLDIDKLDPIVILKVSRNLKKHLPENFINKFNNSTPDYLYEFMFERIIYDRTQFFNLLTPEKQNELMDYVVSNDNNIMSTRFLGYIHRDVDAKYKFLKKLNFKLFLLENYLDIDLIKLILNDNDVLLNYDLTLSIIKRLRYFAIYGDLYVMLYEFEYYLKDNRQQLNPNEIKKRIYDFLNEYKRLNDKYKKGS